MFIDYCKRGLKKYQAKFYVEAILDFDKAIAINALDETAIYGRAASYFMLTTLPIKSEEPYHQKALEGFDCLIKLNSHCGYYFYMRGVIKRKLWLFQAAIADFNAAIVLEPNNDNYLCERASCKESLGLDEAAIKDCDQAIFLNPENLDAILQRARLKKWLKKYKEAILDYQEAIRLSNQSEEIELFKVGIEYCLDCINNPHKPMFKILGIAKFFVSRGIETFKLKAKQINKKSISVNGKKSIEIVNRKSQTSEKSKKMMKK